MAQKLQSYHTCSEIALKYLGRQLGNRYQTCLHDPQPNFNRFDPKEVELTVMHFYVVCLTKDGTSAIKMCMSLVLSQRNYIFVRGIYLIFSLKDASSPDK